MLSPLLYVSGVALSLAMFIRCQIADGAGSAFIKLTSANGITNSTHYPVDLNTGLADVVYAGGSYILATLYVDGIAVDSMLLTDITPN